MEVLLDFLRSAVPLSLRALQDLVVYSGVGESEVQRAGKGLPDLPTQSIGEANLNESSALWIAQECQIAAVC